MTYVFLGNNRTGLEVLRRLVASGHPPAGLVVHPEERARFRRELIDISSLSAERILDARELKVRGNAWLDSIAPDWLVSVLFGFRISEGLLRCARYGGINLHPALLPFNKGANPNVWSIVDGTPAGVTLHLMTAEIDQGDIIAQREVPVASSDTGESLYRKLEDASVDLFMETWPAICDRSFSSRPQNGSGSTHRVSDLSTIDRIDPERTYRAREIIDVIRARTFPPYKGAFLDLGDRRIYLRLALEEEEVVSGS